MVHQPSHKLLQEDRVEEGIGGESETLLDGALVMGSIPVSQSGVFSLTATVGNFALGTHRFLNPTSALNWRSAHLAIVFSRTYYDKLLTRRVLKSVRVVVFANGRAWLSSTPACFVQRRRNDGMQILWCSGFLWFWCRPVCPVLPLLTFWPWETGTIRTLVLDARGFFRRRATLQRHRSPLKLLGRSKRRLFPCSIFPRFFFLLLFVNERTLLQTRDAA